jgi:DNA-binding IclR family transcriptional regulator
VNKAAEILKYLGNQKTAVTGQDVAQAVGLPAGTAMCHLVTLADAGFIQQVGDGWQVGMGLALIWARVKSNLETSIERQKRDLESISIGGN